MGGRIVIGHYGTRILKWTLLGIAIRLVLMPITMHGQDLLFINYFPAIFVKTGAWDPYGFINANFPHFPYTYYGPFLFVIMSAFDLIILNLPGAASLVKMLEAAGPMMFADLGTLDYVRAFSGLDLCRNIFLMKIPYLLFDLAAGYLLLRSARSKETGLAAYRIWMLNIVVLHSAYMIGQADVVTAFFVALALYAAVRKKPYLCVVSLSLGGATKLFPYFLILPACILLASSWRKRALLLSAAGGVTMLLYAPFYLSSGNLIFKFFEQGRHYPLPAQYALYSVFALAYLAVLVKASKDALVPGAEGKALFYFLAIGFLTYAANPISFRYFVFITPLVALATPGRKWLGLFMVALIAVLAFLRLPERDLQMGLFAPLDPAYFTSLPTLQELVGRVVNIEMVYAVMARALVLLFFAAAWWSWRMASAAEVTQHE